ncbi:CHASE domain-containing protein [Luteimonas aquatica]|uniref:CHASE domain-containing protein n=1 Tax=Luteimonas aquatica TaxID=450364 RepID=UPI001F5613A8|nr:CHASE domain-containing protein [Luteimonas aquatica]
MNSPAHPPLDADKEPRAPIRGYLLSGLVLLASLLLVFLYWRNAQRNELRAAHAEFVAEAEGITKLLRQRLLNYELVIRGGVSLFASLERPSPEQWKDYVDGLNIDKHFPALAGLGFAPYLDHAQLLALQASSQANGKPGFTIRPAGVRQRYGPMLYLQPTIPSNVEAIGFDMYSETARRTAMNAAAKSSMARMTEPLRLMPGTRWTAPGLMLYVPVYGGEPPHRTVAERLSALQGWVCMPLDTRALLEEILRTTPRPIEISIVDAAKGGLSVYPGALSAEREGRPLFERTTELDIYGRHWLLHFSSQAQGGLLAGSSGLLAVLIVGVIASLLLSGITLALARTEATAQLRAAQMSESYRRSELRFRNAMRYSASGKALLDHHGTIVEANPSLAAILGSTPELLVGEPFTRRFVGGRDEANDGWAPGQGVRRVTRRLRRADGELRDLQLTYAPVSGNIGQDVTSLVEVEDVTERLRAQAQEQALNRLLEARVAMRTRELTHANQELESFAYSVSHDLRTPLRSIEGFSRLLAERYGDRIDAEGRDYLTRVRNATSRMDGLIDALLRMSRVSRSPLTWAPLDLSAIAADLVRELRESEPQREVRVEIEPGLHAVGDAALVRNLLQNLLDNAWKFTGGRDQARIAFGKGPGQGEQAEFFIRDNGAGFSPEYAGKLFRPFQRLHSQQEFPGYGIGLASVRRIIERHGGSIRAESRLGEGVTFWFTLPRSAEDTEA